MSDDRCQMNDCTNPAERTMAFKRHDDVEVCSTHYRRNIAIKYGVMVAISVTLAGFALALYWLVF